MSKISIHHISLIVADVQISLAFYVDILGLEQTTRPSMNYKGAWLQVGIQQIHLLQLDNPDPTDNRPLYVGRDRHTAFQVNELDELAIKLDAAKISYKKSQSGRAALFCRDPDGNGIELIQTL